jgi:hypothetical protein
MSNADPETLIVDFLTPSQWPANRPGLVEVICAEAGGTLLKELSSDDARWVVRLPAGTTLPINVASGRITAPAQE